VCSSRKYLEVLSLRRVFSPRNVILFLVLLVAIAYYGAYFFTDLLWFGNLGYQSVFLTVLISRIGIAIAAGLLTFIFILMNLLVARRDGPPQPLDYVLAGEVEIPLHIPTRVVTSLTYLGPAVIAVLVALSAREGWMLVQQFINATPFGLADPFFGRDIGFYVFSLPFYRWLYQGVFFILFLALAATVVYYLANRGIDLGRGAPRFSRRAWKHLSFLVAAMVVLKAGGYLLAQFALLYSARGVAFGAAYTDVHAQLPVLRVLTVLALLVGVLIIVNGWMRRTSYVIYGLGALVAASLILGTAYPAFVQQFQVEPDEINKETPYILHNIAYTRAAFDLDRVEEREFPLTQDLTLADIQAETATINNIRLWDWRPLRESYTQLQAIRPYYDFADVDLDRYMIGGRYRQVMIAAREINHNLFAAEARTWMNHHLKYTHGYGVVMSPTTAATTEGMPTFFLRDIPPVSTVPGLTVTRPEIYYGELTNTYAIVNTTEGEFDYPLGDQNQYTRYAGTGGVQLSNPLIKAAFAIRLGSYQIFLADAIVAESRAMIYRNIHERVRKIAPFLMYDSDPYLVIGDDGRLFYIQDAYTVTNLYPYSERHPRGMNYMRNSVKIAINAYDGSVSYYLFDETDPIARTMAKIFPGLFTPASEMPDDMRAHVRYPEDLFSIQADMYATYHMQDSRVFYNREDLWVRPTQLYGEADRPQVQRQADLAQPHYMIIRLPGEEREELVQMLPFSPREKRNMIAWLAARSDGDSYGDLVVYKFPKQELIYGPMQIEARIDQDTTISRDLTLWNQAGSNVMRGTLLVIPIRNSLLYVEPLYLQAAGNRLPELKRVIVSYGDRVVMGENLGQALNMIFGAGSITGPEVPGGDVTAPTVASLARQANQLFSQAQEASQRGDWATYGERLAELESVLVQLERLAGAQPPPAGGQ
jgi:hypothetical protein